MSRGNTAESGTEKKSGREIEREREREIDRNRNRKYIPREYEWFEKDMNVRHIRWTHTSLMEIMCRNSVYRIVILDRIVD